MIRLTISLPLNEELEAQCKELTLDNSKLPPTVARAAAMQGIPLSMFKLNKVSYDMMQHAAFWPDNEFEQSDYVQSETDQAVMVAYFE